MPLAVLAQTHAVLYGKPLMPLTGSQVTIGLCRACLRSHTHTHRPRGGNEDSLWRRVCYRLVFSGPLECRMGESGEVLKLCKEFPDLLMAPTSFPHPLPEVFLAQSGRVQVVKPITFCPFRCKEITPLPSAGQQNPLPNIFWSPPFRGKEKREGSDHALKVIGSGGSSQKGCAGQAHPHSLPAAGYRRTHSTGRGPACLCETHRQWRRAQSQALPESKFQLQQLTVLLLQPTLLALAQPAGSPASSYGRERRYPWGVPARPSQPQDCWI